MNAFLVTMLVCAATLAPPDCTRDTAISVATEPADTLQECISAGQTTLAATAVGPVPGREYVKVLCTMGDAARRG